MVTRGSTLDSSAQFLLRDGSLEKTKTKKMQRAMSITEKVASNILYPLCCTRDFIIDELKKIIPHLPHIFDIISDDKINIKNELLHRCD